MPAVQMHGAEQNRSYIAVVDDDESLCRSFSRLLRTAGFQPVTYLSAEALLGDAKRPRFDCLVLDIQLEGMSGLQLRQRLKAVHDTTPVVFITAHDDPNTRHQALADGCAGYFRKTDSGQLVLNAIRQAIGHIQQEAPAPFHPRSQQTNHEDHLSRGGDV